MAVAGHRKGRGMAEVIVAVAAGIVARVEFGDRAHIGAVGIAGIGRIDDERAIVIDRDDVEVALRVLRDAHLLTRGHRYVGDLHILHHLAVLDDDVMGAVVHVVVEDMRATRGIDVAIGQVGEIVVVAILGRDLFHQRLRQGRVGLGGIVDMEIFDLVKHILKIGVARRLVAELLPLHIAHRHDREIVQGAGYEEGVGVAIVDSVFVEGPFARRGIIVDPVEDAGLVGPGLEEDDRAVGIGAAPTIALLVIGIPAAGQHLGFEGLAQVSRDQVLQLARRPWPREEMDLIVGTAQNIDRLRARVARLDLLPRATGRFMHQVPGAIRRVRALGIIDRKEIARRRANETIFLHAPTVRDIVIILREGLVGHQL